MERLKKLEKHLLYLKHATTRNDTAFPPSFLGPDAHWTSGEKNAFFRSIARHSRWRPDLIAQDLGSIKSVSDVCTYIQLLEEGSIEHPLPLTMDYLPRSAREVSEEWIAEEEGLANEIISNEIQWSHYDQLKSRRTHLHMLKKSLEGASEESQPEAVNRKKTLKRNWRRQDFLSRLTPHSLKKMDFLLRGSVSSRVFQKDGSDMEKNQAVLERKKAFSSKIRSTPIPDILDEKALHLSPASRERIRKRLWARRKRAQESGMSPSKASSFLGKLKRGRPTSHNGLSDDGDNSIKKPNSGIAGMEDQEESAERYQNDILRPYGITKENLVNDGLDIFHLKKIAELSRLYQRVYSFDRVELGRDHTVAYNVLCYLQMSLVHFLVSVIAKAIGHRRVDLRQRRVNEDNPDIDEIRREDILASLISLGQSIVKDNIFERLDRTFNSRHDGEGGSGTEYQVNTSNSAELPLSKDEPCFVSKAPSTCFASCMPMWIDDKNNIDEDLDQRKLLKDLAAEELLEQRFKLVDRKFETQLWSNIDRDEVGGIMDVPQGGHSLQFRPPGGFGQTNTFVDSDEDMT